MLHRQPCTSNIPENRNARSVCLVITCSVHNLVLKPEHGKRSRRPATFRTSEDFFVTCKAALKHAHVAKDEKDKIYECRWLTHSI